jgi:hypothetical protein
MVFTDLLSCRPVGAPQAQWWTMPWRPASRLRRVLTLLLLMALCVGILGFLSCRGDFSSEETPLLTTNYQAVLLTNGQVFFGKLEHAGTKYPVLTNVFYIQNQTNPDTKQVNTVLIKRGKEAHAPDRMILNAVHILVIEPVAPGSQVEKLILDAKNK